MPDQIVSLLAEKGKKYDETGEAIASFEGSIVFLPKGAVPGQNVRVVLIPIQGRTDNRGRVMYQSHPAPPEYHEEWKDNGSGTASLVTIATNWLGQTSEEGKRETRTLGKRDGQPSIKSDFHVVWGADLATSVIEDRQVNLVPLEEEKVEGGKLVWKKTDERPEQMSVLSYPVTKIEIKSGEFVSNKFQNVYDPKWSVSVYCYYRKPESSSESAVSLAETWATMPGWWQKEWEDRYPVCSCGRQRLDTQISDGYGKCEKCRTEETCVRCGMKKTVKNLSGRLVCSDCEPYEAAEQMIETLLPKFRRQELAEEAKKLLAGNALSQVEGEIVLKATLDHVSDSNRIVQKWTGYGWYYFCDDGVYGSKLAPAALTVLQFLPQASGNGLVELIAWLSGSVKPDSSDFYTQSQVKGEKVSLPMLEDTIRKLSTWSLGLADKLRGSEADRIEALGLFEQVKTDLGEDFEGLSKVREILNGNEQDYRAAVIALHECREIERLKAQQTRTAQILKKNEQQIRESQDHTLSLKEELRKLRESVETAQTEWEEAETAALAHLEATYRTDPVTTGTVFEVTFVEGKGKDEGRLIYGPFFDEADGDWIKLIADPFTRVKAVPGVRCFARVRPKNSDTVTLFVYTMDNPSGPKGPGGRKVQVFGYFAVSIMRPEDFEKKIAQVQSQLDEAVNQLEELQSTEVISSSSQIKPVQEGNVESDEDEETSMAAAWREALKKKNRL